jgi:hypothetical protein
LEDGAVPVAIGGVVGEVAASRPGLHVEGGVADQRRQGLEERELCVLVDVQTREMIGSLEDAVLLGLDLLHRRDR